MKIDFDSDEPINPVRCIPPPHTRPPYESGSIWVSDPYDKLHDFVVGHKVIVGRYRTWHELIKPAKEEESQLIAS